MCDLALRNECQRRKYEKREHTRVYLQLCQLKNILASNDLVQLPFILL